MPFPHSFLPPYRHPAQTLVILAVFGSMATSLCAQDFDLYAPHAPLAARARVKLPDVPLAAVDGSVEELLSELKGVMILDSASRVQDPIKPFEGLRIDPAADLTVAREDNALDGVRSHLGRPISIRSLNELARNIVWAYKDHKQPVVDVSIPPGQDITDGVIQVVVTESRIGKICFRGNCETSDCLLSKQGWLRPGQLIHVPCLENELVWYNRNPYRHLTMTLEPGDLPGTTDIIYNVCEEKPVTASVGYDDAGNQLLERERVFAGFHLGNVSGNDDELSYRYTTDAYFSGSTEVHSLAYERPIFENRDTIALFGSWSELNIASMGGPLNGTSWQLSGRYRHTLNDTECQQDVLHFGIDIKGTDNTFEFYRSPNQHNVNIVNFMVGFNSVQRYGDGKTAYGADFFLSPSNVLSNNRSSDFGQLRSSADAAYAYARGYLERQYDLNAHSDFVVKVTGQVATARLLPSEQLSLGGYNSIRGFDMHALNGDSAYVANFEYRSKPVFKCHNGKQHSFTGLAFADVGQQFNYGSDATLSDNQFLASVGVGLRYVVDRNTTVRFDYGFPLRGITGPSALVSSPNDDGRVHLGAVFSY